jgi:hypothetical protein
MLQHGWVLGIDKWNKPITERWFSWHRVYKEIKVTKAERVEMAEIWRRKKQGTADSFIHGWLRSLRGWLSNVTLLSIPYCDLKIKREDFTWGLVTAIKTHFCSFKGNPNFRFLRKTSQFWNMSNSKFLKMTGRYDSRLAFILYTRSQSIFFFFCKLAGTEYLWLCRPHILCCSYWTLGGVPRQL